MLEGPPQSATTRVAFRAAAEVERRGRPAAARPAQYDRYRRHLILPEIGLEGQRALLDARVLLIGAGGLGCPTAQYLAAAGVGTLGIVDFDRVDATNLHRQVLYGTADVGGRRSTWPRSGSPR